MRDNPLIHILRGKRKLGNVMFSYTRPVLHIESEVPYSTLIYGWLAYHKGDMSSFVQKSRKYEPSYLAWETVRKVRNPFFVTGTGFEGYYVGKYGSPKEIVDQLLQMGHYMLRSNYRLYRFNPLFRSTLMKTLRAEASDPLAIEVWSAQFGAALGKLRCNLLTNAQARYFQAGTYQSTYSLPKMRYEQRDCKIEQSYRVPCRGSETPSWLTVRLESLLKPSDTEARLVVQAIGKFGHPLVREYLNERSLR